jgi:ubiquinone/menaquinone biosynthesis C-methylase UbiE
VFARVYGRCSQRLEKLGNAERRARLLDGLTGRVLEVGAGNGLNFAHYPSSVTEVIALEPEPYLRRLALEQAGGKPVKITVLDGVAEELPFPDHSFDAVVASLVLCSVYDQKLALAELRRVLKPEGELRYYEHVVSRGRWAARFQRLLDAAIWPRMAGGCHLARDTGAAIRGAGFEVQSEERVAIKTSAAEPPIPHLLGRARAPMS